MLRKVGLDRWVCCEGLYVWTALGGGGGGREVEDAEWLSHNCCLTCVFSRLLIMIRETLVTLREGGAVEELVVEMPDLAAYATYHTRLGTLRELAQSVWEEVSEGESSYPHSFLGWLHEASRFRTAYVAYVPADIRGLAGNLCRELNISTSDYESGNFTSSSTGDGDENVDGNGTSSEGEGGGSTGTGAA